MAFNLNKSGEQTPGAGSESRFDLSKTGTPKDENKKSNKGVFILIVVLLIGSGAWYCLSKSKPVSTIPSSPAVGGAVEPKNDTPIVNDVKVSNSNTAVIDSIGNASSANDSGKNENYLNNKIPASFAKASVEINDIDKNIVEDIVLYLQKNPGALVTINGFASSEGELMTNKKIARQRAEAFKNYLVTKGIDASRIITKGKGIEYPVAPNDTEQGRQKNRRVEIVLKKLNSLKN